MLQHSHPDNSLKPLPSLAENELSQRPETFLAASNLAITRDDFNNVLHGDRDDSIYTFGKWIHAMQNNLLVEEAEDIKNIQGGEFIVPEYCAGIRFSLPALYEMMRCGPKDLHCTTRSTMVYQPETVMYGALSAPMKHHVKPLHRSKYDGAVIRRIQLFA